MGDLIIKGGTVVDGTGAPGRLADIRVAGGTIAEVGVDLPVRGERVIRADGAVVAPGFIDSHTHFDATVFWDPWCDPMPQHGVTTVVAGNCSLGFAPMRPADRKAQIDVFSFIEDLPADMLEEAIPWNWETFGDFAEALSHKPLALNLLTFVGHAQIRSYVMGADAWIRVATAEEIAAMADILSDALTCGALGMSFSLYDRDRQGRLVPSCFADDAEMDALVAKLGEHDAVLQFVPGDTTDVIIGQLEWFGGFLARHNVVGFYNILVHLDSDPERSRRLRACLEALHRKGAQIFGMASPRPFELSLGFEGSMCLLAVPAWNELVQAQLPDKRRMVDDSAWRDRARADVDSHVSVMFPFDKPDLLPINSVADAALQPWIGRTLGDLIAERGGHPSDVLADWLLENDFAATFTFAIANTDLAEVAGILKSPVAFISGSDAGAHLQMFCAAGDTTLLLTRFVRDRGDLTLEEAVHALTGRQAELLRLPGRGTLAPGQAADITIFALDELRYGPQRLVDDLPGGRQRLTRDPGGYRYTIVTGEVVQEAGALTDALPAGWRSRAE
ncbi:amidohydrolase family protein [Novosphingobium sp. G106]|uniref:N-acyl-D-amino-acid deacylase family protein n=1 Tax=Novosphingobium sp. G106 TaxID=2849500 RepID=UPI001C2DAEF2|nr:amidohydrolase family protein [Novosphingobium sp. G106]MBV1687661.1 amidohydrolase family protein [Novosphingobium sp. G106]